MNTIVFTLTISLLLTSYSSVMQSENMELSTEKDISIVGIWAMIPLRNGIANVVEFTREGKSNLHAFNCRKKSLTESESSTYTINDEKNNIRFDSSGRIDNLSIVSIKKKTMTLRQMVGEDQLEFAYIRTNKVSPLCFLYKESQKEKNKRTAFKETNFTHEPWIPDSPMIARYVGKWADDNGHIQIEVKKDVSGKYKIYHQNNENWNYLFNSVHWSGEELRFRIFAYSDKQELFDHNYHKSDSLQILTSVDDLNKIKHSFFILGKQYDFILTRE